MTSFECKLTFRHSPTSQKRHTPTRLNQDTKPTSPVLKVPHPKHNHQFHHRARTQVLLLHLTSLENQVSQDHLLQIKSPLLQQLVQLDHLHLFPLDDWKRFLSRMKRLLSTPVVRPLLRHLRQHLLPEPNDLS